MILKLKGERNKLFAQELEKLNHLIGSEKIHASIENAGSSDEARNFPLGPMLLRLHLPCSKRQAKPQL